MISPAPAPRAQRAVPAGPAPPFPQGLPYLPLSDHYRRRFGCRVYKVTVATAQTCPNREGLGGTRVCVFCDPWGSAADHEAIGLPLAEQIARGQARMRARYKAERFLVYFQAYTTTFERVARLESLLEEALATPDVVGVVIGTRPDCLPSRVLALLGRLARRHYVSVELGVQSLDDGQLRFLSRGHTAQRSLEAIAALREVGGINVCAHLIFGIPGETDGQLRRTAAALSAAGVDGVKLHNLHVLAGTPLQALYEAGRFRPIDLEEYARRVALFLSHLSPDVAIHRLAAVASRWEEVVAPAWVRGKMLPTQYIRDYLVETHTWQGKYFLPGRADPAGAADGAGGHQTGGDGWA